MGRLQMDSCGGFKSTCVGCQGSEGLEVFETHAGAFHTACSHAACSACLRQLVLRQLHGARQCWQLSVFCPEPKCQKRLPQRLVLQVPEALALAIAIDSGSLWPCLASDSERSWQERCIHVLSSAWLLRGCRKRLPQHPMLQPRCPLCGTRGHIYANGACGHGACKNCWIEGLQNKLQWCRQNFALDVPCVHEGCNEGCSSVLRLFKEGRADIHVREVHEQLQSLSSWWEFPKSGALI